MLQCETRVFKAFLTSFSATLHKTESKGSFLRSYIQSSKQSHAHRSPTFSSPLTDLTKLSSYK